MSKNAAPPQAGRLNLLVFSDRIKILHLTWLAFFITFFVWFNHAPLLGLIREAFNLTDAQIKTLLIVNVALTIPARVVVGMLVDKLGPRLMFSALLAISGVLCLAFSMANSFQMLALTRFLMGFVGAGFVIGIRMISEWFPARQVGVAQGIYGGWGNFGSAGAAMLLPTVALLFGGAEGWRYAAALSGLMALGYAVVYYLSVRDTPKGSTYFAPKKTGAMELSSPGDFALYGLMQTPLFLALGLLAWKLGPGQAGLLPGAVVWGCYGGLVLLYGVQMFKAWQINAHIFRGPVPEIDRYHFRQVAVLELAYLTTFGAELAVVSMLPLFYQDTFGLGLVLAGLFASAFAFTNLVARPGGGFFSDLFGRKRTLALLLAGMGLGYLAMSQINASIWLPLAIAITMACSFLGQAGSGAVFAIVPLIKRRMTGQIAGQVGAYGNVGAVLFLTVLSFVSPQTFFLVIASIAGLVCLLVFWLLDEPRGQMAETLPDGTVQMIDVG